MERGRFAFLGVAVLVVVFAGGCWNEKGTSAERHSSQPNLDRTVTGSRESKVAPKTPQPRKVEEAEVNANAKPDGPTIITPHLNQRIEPGTNVIWCSTFQLAWNELCDLAGGPIKMDAPPPMVPTLNTGTASKDDLDSASYVAAAGLLTEGFRQNLRDEIEQKFHGRMQTDLLDSLPAMQWIAYACLVKELYFEWAFTPLPNGMTFAGRPVDAFGIRHFAECREDEAKMASQVDVLDYKGNDDFVIELKTRSRKDRLILAKVTPSATLGETVKSVQSRVDKATPTPVAEWADLIVPVVDFDRAREYTELYGHTIYAANKELDGLPIIFAKQSIRFRLDERGAVLRSEAGIGMGGGIAQRHLIFDKPFLILLERKDANNPYFALWVGNAELLQSAKKEETDIPPW